MSGTGLPSHVLVGALIRSADSAGGNATVLARGDRDSGAMIVLCSERGVVSSIVERSATPTGMQWIARRVDDHADYVDRHRTRDPDLWVIELDIADAERFTLNALGQV